MLVVSHPDAMAPAPLRQGCTRRGGGGGLRGGPSSGWTGGWRRLPKRTGGGYCRLQMPLRPALGVRGTVAGHRLGALEGGLGGIPPPLPMHPRSQVSFDLSHWAPNTEITVAGPSPRAPVPPLFPPKRRRPNLGLAPGFQHSPASSPMWQLQPGPPPVQHVSFDLEEQFNYDLDNVSFNTLATPSRRALRPQVAQGSAEHAPDSELKAGALEDILARWAPAAAPILPCPRARGTFLLSSGGAGGAGITEWPLTRGRIPTQNRFPCQTLVARLHQRQGIRRCSVGNAHATPFNNSAPLEGGVPPSPPVGPAPLILKYWANFSSGPRPIKKFLLAEPRAMAWPPCSVNPPGLHAHSTRPPCQPH